MRFLSCLSLFAALLIFAATTAKADVSKAETTPVLPPVTSGPEFRSAVERRTFELVNAYRQKEGFDSLTWSEDMAKVAREHSKDMATGEIDFGHARFNDRVHQMKEAWPGFRGMGENVLYTDNLAEVEKTAMTLWLHSPHHLANIRGDYNYSGMGVWQKDDGTLYFTQIFVKVEKGN